MYDVPKKKEGNNRGGKGKDDTCDHGLYFQNLESRSVPKIIIKSLEEEMINQQSAARSTSSTKQHKTYLSVTYQHTTRPLALDRQTTTATESGTTAITKHAIPLSTHHHLRVAQINNRRRNLYNTTLEAPGTQPLAILLCGFNWRSNRNHYYLLLV